MSLVKKDLKDTQEKLPLQNIDPIALKTLAKLQQYGAKKYKGSDGISWQHGEPSTYVGALLRHLTSWQEGEIVDPESGLTHLEHAFYNAYILLWLENYKKQQVDTSINIEDTFKTSKKDAYDIIRKLVKLESIALDTIKKIGKED